MAFFGLLGRGRHERTGFQLYSAAVAAARTPYYYAELGVPDTLDGRFDLVGLHASLLIRRLRTLPPPGAAVSQAVFDAMFSDMDINLREMGVSDMRLAKNVRAMWEAFHGRATAYEAAIAAPDPAALEVSLAKNIWRSDAAPDQPPGAPALAAIVRQLVAQVDGAPPQELTTGSFRFQPPVPA